MQEQQILVEMEDALEDIVINTRYLIRHSQILLFTCGTINIKYPKYII